MTPPMASFCQVRDTRASIRQSTMRRSIKRLLVLGRKLRPNKSCNLSGNVYNPGPFLKLSNCRDRRSGMNVRELSALFRKLGARNPESWARSQLEENIPQLARFLFLRQAWKLVIDENDHGWISEMRLID